MEDSIIVNYADGTSEEYTGKMISDTKYPMLELHERSWVNKELGYSVILKVRKLDEETRKIFGCPPETNA